MDEYVNRKKLEEAFDNADTDFCESDMDGHNDWGFGRENVRDVIRSVPAADVAPVVHGKWAPSEENPGFLVCSACGDCYVVDEWADGKKWRYCPNCGAKMDGRGEGDGQKD